MKTKTKIDIAIGDHGSIILFTPMNDEAKKWIRDNVQPDAQWYGNSLAVERRYAANLADGMRIHGFNLA